MDGTGWYYTTIQPPPLPPKFQLPPLLALFASEMGLNFLTYWGCNTMNHRTALRRATLRIFWGRRSRGQGDDCALFPDFGQNVNPICTRGTVTPNTLLLAPLDIQNLPLALLLWFRELRDSFSIPDAFWLPSFPPSANLPTLLDHQGHKVDLIELRKGLDTVESLSAGAAWLKVWYTDFLKWSQQHRSIAGIA